MLFLIQTNQKSKQKNQQGCSSYGRKEKSAVIQKALLSKASKVSQSDVDRTRKTDTPPPKGNPKKERITKTVGLVRRSNSYSTDASTSSNQSHLEEISQMAVKRSQKKKDNKNKYTYKQSQVEDINHEAVKSSQKKKDDKNKVLIRVATSGSNINGHLSQSSKIAKKKKRCSSRSINNYNHAESSETVPENEEKSSSIDTIKPNFTGETSPSSEETVLENSSFSSTQDTSVTHEIEDEWQVVETNQDNHNDRTLLIDYSKSFIDIASETADQTLMFLGEGVHGVVEKMRLSLTKE